MVFLRFLLLLCAAPHPTPAQAAVGRAALPVHIRSADAPYAAEVARALDGQEVFRSLEGHLPDVQTRDGDGPARRPASLCLSRLRPLPRAVAPRPGDAVVPLAERLPFHATAPPLG